MTPHIKVNIALLGFFAYRFWSREFKWWLNTGTYVIAQRVPRRTLVVEIYSSFVPTLF